MLLYDMPKGDASYLACPLVGQRSYAQDEARHWITSKPAGWEVPHLSVGQLTCLGWATPLMQPLPLDQAGWSVTSVATLPCGA